MAIKNKKVVFLLSATKKDCRRKNCLRRGTFCRTILSTTWEPSAGPSSAPRGTASARPSSVAAQRAQLHAAGPVPYEEEKEPEEADNDNLQKEEEEEGADDDKLHKNVVVVVAAAALAPAAV